MSLHGVKPGAHCDFCHLILKDLFCLGKIASVGLLSAIRWVRVLKLRPGDSIFEGKKELYKIIIFRAAKVNVLI